MNNELKLLGVMLQVIGAVMAAAGIVYLSLVVGTVIAFPVTPVTMTALIVIVGIDLFVGFAIIAWGGVMYAGVEPARCPNCDRELDKQFLEWCPGCGWTPSFEWPPN